MLIPHKFFYEAHSEFWHTMERKNWINNYCLTDLLMYLAMLEFTLRIRLEKNKN